MTELYRRRKGIRLIKLPFLGSQDGSIKEDGSTLLFIEGSELKQRKISKIKSKLRRNLLSL